MKQTRLPNIPYIVGAGILLAFLLAAAYVSAQDEPGALPEWDCTYLPVIFGTLPDDTPNLPGEPPHIPVLSAAVCNLIVTTGDPQQPTPTATATDTPEATATVEPTATIDPTVTVEPTVGATETVTPEPTATCEPDDDDGIGTMHHDPDDDWCDDDD